MTASGTATTRDPLKNQTPNPPSTRMPLKRGVCACSCRDENLEATQDRTVLTVGGGGGGGQMGLAGTYGPVAVAGLTLRSPWMGSTARSAKIDLPVSNGAHPGPCFGGRTPPCVTFRWVSVSLRGPGQSPVLRFACCVGSLCSDGRCGRCSLWCRFCVSGAQW